MSALAEEPAELRVAAPGKLVVTGGYAVLEGAPAIVVAVDRHAVADAWFLVSPSPLREVHAAFRDELAPSVDVSALYEGGSKLGLGSSAAALVAALGADAAARGEDIRRTTTRAALFERARRAHGEAQGGGSGIDVAASVYGGALCYSVVRGTAFAHAVQLPESLHLVAFWSGTSARTSDLLARVRTLRDADPDRHRTHMKALTEASTAAVDALDGGDAPSFITAARAFGDSLAALGDAAGAPISPPAFRELAARAAGEGATFLPSGAGGGDVGLFLGTARPSCDFRVHAESLGMRPVGLRVDYDGVHVL
ncbi:hypothetical protein LVJ94_20035 [Pendulispora rubella]|uniref:phosphomevalonate kinase n=1 Tax=Pendulispora rubella TaxID=2741070 RepID=A0ABZ2LI15_9BACT